MPCPAIICRRAWGVKLPGPSRAHVGTPLDSPRVGSIGNVFRTILMRERTVRENHVVEFEEGCRITLWPAERARNHQGICGAGNLCRSTHARG